MASSLVQIRLDDELKSEACALYEALGIDLPTAVRMFKRSVMVKGIPFSMTLPKQEYKAERAVRAMREISEEASKNGVADMTLEEIEDEIATVRREKNVTRG